LIAVNQSIDVCKIDMVLHFGIELLDLFVPHQSIVRALFERVQVNDCLEALVIWYDASLLG
jgi:hypothetical protein